MKYKCENELHTLDFKDFDVSDISFNNGKLKLNTGGGVAKYNNSCNETLEERYISESEIAFFDAKISKMFLEGAKYYNADDVLLKETPDEPVEERNYAEIFKKMKEGTVFFINSKSTNNGRYEAEIAIDIENDTYWINVDFEKVVVGFDRFMNRVMN